MQTFRRAVSIRQCRPLSPRTKYNATFHHPQRRDFYLPTVLIPPVVFGGLVITLWTWKCLMMVVFQNKIIYMPGLPPNARREKIDDYRSQCGGIEWREERIRSLDGTRISLCVASVTNGKAMKHIYILYFQGNASSIPPRLPFLSPVLRLLRDRPGNVRYTMVCCSYRGFWTSSGRPSEKGVTMDAIAALNWIRDADEIVIWGQSIGAGVASNLATQSAVRLLVLETPFISVRAMLETLYPQRWLPYKHLWPFLRNHLDSYKALALVQGRPRILILQAGKDELVPKEHGDILEARCKELGLDVRRKLVGNSLHTEVLVRPEGRMIAVEAIHRVGIESLATQDQNSIEGG